MGKLEKKRAKLQARIDELQNELTLSLTKKSSATAEISVSEYTRKIQQLRDQLNSLK